MDKHYLTPLFAPSSIVVIGDSDGEPGGSAVVSVQQALRETGFQGRLQFVDLHTSGTLEDLSQAHSDLAVIALPQQQAPDALELAARMGCSSALMVSHGVDAAQAARLREIAQRDGVLLLGPNSLGFQRPPLGLNASACGPLASPGPLGLVSQSGALTVSMLDWARQNRVGFSSVISVGPHSVVGIAESLDFLASDAQTHSIILYLEGITNARRFMSALRSAANAKPVIVLKAGRRPAGGE
ncbi:CoA-binding protein, partial [Metallibacterium scheffleri]|uniref:CoA-binding protein n=1 Tax=Metallibacterium scheffleri TaxID=993689 RepID=UPI0031BB9481|nr:GNAT family N-acetyltransferase [Metallibacterium scheffleri]